MFAAEIGGFLLSIYYNLQAVKLQFYGHHSGQLRQSIIAALNESSSEWDTAPGTTVADLAQLVWGVASLNVPAPAPHEYFVMMTMAFWTVIVTVASFSGTSTSTLIRLVGYINIVMAVLLSAAPLSSIFSVVRNCSSDTIHRPTLVSNFISNAFWGAYGVAIGDTFVAAPAAIGMALSVSQLALAIIIRRRLSKRLDGKTEEQTTEVTQEDSTNVGSAQHDLVVEETPPKPLFQFAEEIMVDDEEAHESRPSRVRPSLSQRTNSVRWFLESDLLPRNFISKSPSIGSLNHQNSLRFELERTESLRRIPARSYSERHVVSSAKAARIKDDDEIEHKDEHEMMKRGISRTVTTRF